MPTQNKDAGFFQKLPYALGLKKHSLKEQVEEVIEEFEQENGLQETREAREEREMIKNVLSFRELSVEDVMIPAADIIWINYNHDFKDIQALIADHAHTRMPVCKDTLDNTVGFIHIKDIIGFTTSDKTFEMDKLLRKLLFVPPSMRLSALLLKMQAERVHMAIVIDEYGGTTGLVTLEDVVEEIVGEIEDEHDVEEENQIKQLDAKRYELSARLPIEEAEEKLGVLLRGEDEDFDTIGGLLFMLLGHVPAVGEVARHKSGAEFTILDADARKIKRVKVTLP